MIREFRDKYRWLSNFYPCKLTYQGIEYASAEHAYMSAKSDDPEWKAFCQNANNSPGKVKRKSKKIELVENWYDIRVEVMREVLQAKFSKEPFRSKLLRTGRRQIKEGNSWGDVFWGVDSKTGEGENVLGTLLMDIRK